MRNLIVQEWMSVDCFAADKNGSLDFFAHTVRDVYADDAQKVLLETIDCILLGRKTYDQFAAVWPDRSTEGDVLAQTMNTTRKMVFSASMKEAQWGKWMPPVIEPGDAVACISKLKTSPGKNLVIWGSISLFHLLMRSRLVDECHVFISPAITGGGKRLFPEGINPTDLTLISSKCYDSGLVFLKYQVNNLK